MLFLFQDLIPVYSFPPPLQILVSALLAINLWHNAQAVLYPATTTVTGHGNNYAYFSGPVSTQTRPTFVNSVGGGAGAGVGPVIPSAPGGAPGASGLALDFAVSEILKAH